MLEGDGAAAFHEGALQLARVRELVGEGARTIGSLLEEILDGTLAQFAALGLVVFPEGHDPRAIVAHSKASPVGLTLLRK